MNKIYNREIVVFVNQKILNKMLLENRTLEFDS